MERFVTGFWVYPERCYRTLVPIGTSDQCFNPTVLYLVGLPQSKDQGLRFIVLGVGI